MSVTSRDLSVGVTAPEVIPVPPRLMPTRSGLRLAGWTRLLGAPGPEAARVRRSARLGGVIALLSLMAYLTWRVAFTLPPGPRWAAWLFLAFEALPLPGLVIRLVTLWNIDSAAPRVVTDLPDGYRVAVLIPTYNEPAEVIAPTIAASCALEPSHETWVLDDGDRPWVAEMAAAYGARYVARTEHDHAKAGNLNHALALMEAESRELGLPDVDVIAVLDCDHVPLPHFLTATLGWFDDPDLALVQGPQNYYNFGAFDDDGYSGDQGVFFNVLMPARNHDGAGPFWCGSTSLLRTRALREIGGIATETIVEDMHTTLGLIRAGWKTVYHHQTLALGLAPATAEQYLLQRRRWGLGSMQVLSRERLWAAKGWLSWRNFYEYLSGTLWWLEGIATLVAFFIPAAIILVGVPTTAMSPWTFLPVFLALTGLRMWGVLRLYRGNLHLASALALRIFRIPVGLACLWWLVSRRTLEFQVTPKAAADTRARGKVPRVLMVIVAANLLLLGYGTAAAFGLMPARPTADGTIAVATWVFIATAILFLGVHRIRHADYASSRRNAHRVNLTTPVELDGRLGTLLDLSVGGGAIELDSGEASALTVGQEVQMTLAGAATVPLRVVRTESRATGDKVSLKVARGDWATARVLSLWLFHTPGGLLPGLPLGVPAVAVTCNA